MNLTETFVDTLDQLRTADISTAVEHQAKRCLIDYLGATIVGAQMVHGKATALLDSLGERDGDARVIGMSRQATIATAALVNGLSSHAAELDDGVISGIVHPGAPVFSALLPFAEKEGVTGKRLIVGIVVGYEAAVRIADAIQPSHKQLGHHATATCGAIGAALGIAAMLGIGVSIAQDVLSAAAISASGTLKALEDDSELKPFNVGRAALNGVLAVMMARAGFRGPNDVLGGKAGFFSVMAGAWDVSHLQLREGGRLAVERVYVKSYAACRYCHPAIEAAQRIRSKNSFEIRDIASIDVATFELAVAKHDHAHIGSVSSAKMSIPYSVSVALMSGRADVDEFTVERIGNPAISRLARRVSVRTDERLTAMFPRKSAALVEVRTHGGDCYTEEVDCPKGEPDAPLSDDEVQDKFLSLAQYAGRRPEEGMEIVDAVWGLKEEPVRLFSLL